MKYMVLGYDNDRQVVAEMKFRLVSDAFSCFVNATYYSVEFLDLDSGEVLGTKYLGQILHNFFQI